MLLSIRNQFHKNSNLNITIIVYHLISLSPIEKTREKPAKVTPWSIYHFKTNKLSITSINPVHTLLKTYGTTITVFPDAVDGAEAVFHADFLPPSLLRGL